MIARIKKAKQEETGEAAVQVAVLREGVFESGGDGGGGGGCISGLWCF